jgi:3-dehydroquinate synthase
MNRVVNFCYDVGKGDTRNIYLGNNILEDLPTYARTLKADKFFIVTDSNVTGVLTRRIKNILGKVNETHVVSFPAGEQSKTLSTLEELGGQILEKEATKSSVIACLGGGVVGNMGGLLAALLFRGLRFFHLPTTMIAQIDSAIGIKQAVNYKKGKNLFGQYYSPEFVFIDLDLLRTLPERHIKAGLAEAVKHALCQEPDFFDFIEKKATDLSWEDIDWISRHTIELKLELLKIDPYEGKLDPQLELGHTLGHAIEIIKKGELLHGEAIAIGMVIESGISCRLGFMLPALAERIEKIFKALGLPTRLPPDVSVERIIDTLRYDNKRRSVQNDFFLLKDFTRFYKTNGRIGTKVPDKILEDVLKDAY